MILSPAERKQIQDQRRLRDGHMLVHVQDGEPLTWQAVRTVVHQHKRARESCAPALGRR